MNPHTLAALLDALMLLHQGRAHAAAEALTAIIREHGGLPTLNPTQDDPLPVPGRPLWMRPGA